MLCPSALLLFSSFVVAVNGFLRLPVAVVIVSGRGRYECPILPSKLFPTEEEEAASSGGVDFDKFNPFDYKKNQDGDNSAYSYSGNVISLRKTRMQELVNDMLSVVPDESEMQRIVQEGAVLLLYRVSAWQIQPRV